MPRRSRISWKRRELAEPPSIESSSDAAKRRRSERETPRPPRHRCTCSVSLRWNTERGVASPTQTGPDSGGVVRHLRERREPGLDGVRERLVLEVPGGRDDDVRADVARPVIGADVVRRGAGDDLRRSDDGPPERMLREDRRGDQVVDEVLRRVLVHRDLLEHDVSLGVHLGRVELRLEQHVGHDVERRLEVGVEDAGVDDRVLLGRGGVQLAAEAVEDLGDLHRRVARRALEQEVLDQVRDALLPRSPRRASRRRSRCRWRPSAPTRRAR